MVSYRWLLAAVEAGLLGPKPAPHHRTELSHALHVCLPGFQSFLKYPGRRGAIPAGLALDSFFTKANEEVQGPKAEDRAQVASKDVRLPDMPPTLLTNQDAQIALKLSDDYNLNETYCVGLLVAAHREWNLLGQGPLEILRFSAGLWFTERRALITSLLLLLRAVILKEKLDPYLVGDIRLYIEKLLEEGLRTRLIILIKELNREEPAGLGGHGVEPYVMDSSGAVVQRCDVIQKERLSLCHCLFFTCLVVRINGQDAVDLYNLLKDCSTDESLSQDVVKIQITYTIMFTLTNSLMSAALGRSQELGSSLALDAGFRRDFQQLIMDTGDLGATAEGFTGVIRLVWAVYLMLTNSASEVTPTSSSEDLCLCLDRACEHDVFEFLNTRVLQTATYENDDELLSFKYNASLYELLTHFFSLPAGREKIKELKHAATVALGGHKVHGKEVMLDDSGRAQQQAMELQAKPFISLLGLVGEIYQREPELILDNENLWNFARFVGEEHTSYRTLVAFLDMLTALAASEEGAKRVYQLLQNKTFRTLGWQTFFDSLVVYDQQYWQCLQTAGAFLPPFQEGDAQALAAYLKLLRRVMERGNQMEQSQWFVDIEPLFKLLSHKNVPPSLKAGLRNAIATFVPVSPGMKNKVWSLVEQYDLPVVDRPLLIHGSGQLVSSQVYDITFELNEVEARQEEYPSTLSYLRLINVLLAHESDTSDKGGRYIGIFRFVRDQVFAPYNQRSYTNPVEKWELVAAALHHFKIMLSKYELTDEDVRRSADDALPPEKYLSGVAIPYFAASCTTQAPIAELMKDLMNEKVIYRNLMSILMLGVDTLMEQRISQLYGPVLEEAICVSLQILLLAFSKDSLCAQAWGPVYQPIHVNLSHDIQQIVTVLEYARYDKLPLIQQCSVQLMKLLSARMPHLVSVILEAGAASKLIEGYAACLEARTEEAHVPKNPEEDIGSLILRLLLANLDQPPPNVTHLLLKFDVNQPVEKAVLQPNRHYSCLQVILNILETLAKPEVNSGLHELGFQLMSELCADPITGGPVVELLNGEKYKSFPKRTSRSSRHMLMNKGKGPASEDEYVCCISEACDPELQTRGSGTAAAAVPPIASSGSAAIGFLNPTPLATRCTTKQNDGPSVGGTAALRSSWIQRLLPGMLGEETRASNWKEKGDIPGPLHEENVHLLLEDTTNNNEDSGHEAEALVESQAQGQESCGRDRRSTTDTEGSSMEPAFSHRCSSESPAYGVREGPACVSEDQRDNPGGESISTSNDAGILGDEALPNHARHSLDESLRKGESGCIPVEWSRKPVLDSAEKLPGVGMQRADRAGTEQLNCRLGLQGNLPVSPSGAWGRNVGKPVDRMQGPREVAFGWSRLSATPLFASDMMVRESGNALTSMKPRRYAGKGENVPAVRPSGLSMPAPSHLRPRKMDKVVPMTQTHEGGEGMQTFSRHPHNKGRQLPDGLSVSPRAGKPFPGGLKLGFLETQTARGAAADMNQHVNVEGHTGYQAGHNSCKGKDMGSSDLSSLPPLSFFAPFKRIKDRRSSECHVKSKVDPAVSGESLLTPLFASHDYREHAKARQDGGAGLLKEGFDSTIFAPYKPSSEPHILSRRAEPEKYDDAVALPQRPSVATVPFKTAEEQNDPSASSSEKESLPLNLMDPDGQNAPDRREEDTGAKPDSRLEINPQPAVHQHSSSGNHPTVYGPTLSVYSSSPWPETSNQLVDARVKFPTQTSGSGFHGGRNQQASVCFKRPTSIEGHKMVNTSAIELSSRRPSLYEESTDEKEVSRQPGNKELSATQSFGLQKSVPQGMGGSFHPDQDVQQQQHLNVQEGSARDSRLYHLSLGEGSSGASSPIPGGDVPCDHQSRMSVFPVRHQNMESSRQSRLKKETPSSSGVKGGVKTQGRDAELKDVGREQTINVRETEGGDRMDHDSLRQRLDGGVSAEGGAGSNRHHLSGQGVGQGGEGRQQRDGSELWADAPGDRPGRSSRKRSRETQASMYDTPAQNHNTSTVAPSQGAIGPNGELFQTPPRAQAWLQRWMPSLNPPSDSFNALQGSPQSAIPGRLGSQQESLHATNRSLGVQGSSVQGKPLNETGQEPQERWIQERGNSYAGASSGGNYKRSNSLCLGFYTVPSGAAMALVGAASRRAVPLPPQRVGTRVAVWPDPDTIPVIAEEG